jgi:hypothetical protein
VTARLARPLVAVAVGLAVASVGRPAGAEGEVGFGLWYDARLPVASFRDAVTNPSWQGFGGSLDYFVFDWMSVGLAGQYNLFQQDFGKQTTPLPTGAITTETFRYVSIWSVFPVARFYPLPNAVIRPFFSLGIGPVNVIDGALASDVFLHHDSWHLLVQPSLGAFLRLGPDAEYGLREDPAYGISASFSYAITTASVAGANDLSFVGVQLGLYAKY